MQSLANGTELGAYTIVRLIGRGGMGEVYEAFESRLERRVALKVISPAKTGGHGEVDLVRRFLQEARTLAQINHPNVVTIYSIDRVNDIQFIAMEYVEGASFRDLFSMFAFSSEEAAPIFLQLLEGMRALHENRILHRDIKPHNLMLRPDGKVKILDFGIAKRLNDRKRENTTVGVVIGTLSYLPPEVLYGTPATPRSDLWSLGAIFYECMVGQPLVSLTSVKIKGARAATDSDVIFPQETLKWVASEMRAIVGRMSDRQPEHRYESAAQAIEDIKRFIANRPPMAPEMVKALAQAVEDIEDLKESVAKEPKTDSRSKRDFTVGVLGGNAADVAVEMTPKMEEFSAPIISEVMRDSISARRKAQGRARFNRSAWKQPAMIVGAMALAAGLTVKFMNSRQQAHTAFEPPARPAATEVFTLKSPANNQTVWLEPNALPTMSWSKNLRPGQFELQIATDANFNSIVMREEVSGTSYRPSRILSEGEYHWQLWPRGQDLPVGPETFTVSQLAPLEMIWPKPEQIFELPHRAQVMNVELTWKCKPGVNTYGAQVASDADFKNVVAETVMGGCTWKNVNLPAGDYYWRVRVEEPAVAQLATINRQEFSVKSEAAPASAPAQSSAPRTPSAPPATHMLAPRLKHARQSVTLQFGKVENVRDLASVRKSLAEAPTLAWTPVKGAKSYNLQISSNPEFTKPLSEETVGSSSFEWRQAVPGKFHWRVRAAGDGGAQSSYSNHGTLEVNLPEPVLGSAYTYAEGGQLEWDAVPLAEKYIVQTGSSREMANVQESEVEEPAADIVVKDKPVFVRVAAADAAGERVSGFSQVATITMETAIRLKAPGLVTPPKGAKVTMPKSGRISIVFTWKPVDKATGYYVEISRYPNFSKTMQKKALHNTKWVLKNAKFNGKIYWRVRSEGKGARSPWSRMGYFEVR